MQAERRIEDVWEAKVLELAERVTVEVYDKAKCRVVDVPAPPVTVSGLLTGLGVQLERHDPKDADQGGAYPQGQRLGAVSGAGRGQALPRLPEATEGVIRHTLRAGVTPRPERV